MLLSDCGPETVNRKALIAKPGDEESAGAPRRIVSNLNVLPLPPKAATAPGRRYQGFNSCRWQAGRGHRAEPCPGHSCRRLSHGVHSEEKQPSVETEWKDLTGEL